MSKVTIYSTPTCHFCQLAKEFFKENKISYTEHDVLADLEKRREMMEISGQLGVPVIRIGQNVIVGFNQERVEALLNESKS